MSNNSRVVCSVHRTAWVCRNNRPAITLPAIRHSRAYITPPHRRAYNSLLRERRYQNNWWKRVGTSTNGSRVRTDLREGAGAPLCG